MSGLGRPDFQEVGERGPDTLNSVNYTVHRTQCVPEFFVHMEITVHTGTPRSTNFFKSWRPRGGCEPCFH